MGPEDKERFILKATRGVLIRDFLIFQLKLALDGVKDAGLRPLHAGRTSPGPPTPRPSSGSPSFHALQNPPGHPLGEVVDPFEVL